MLHPGQNSKFDDYGFSFFSSNACQFHHMTILSYKNCPLAYSLCGDYDNTGTIRIEDNLTYKDAVKHCLAKNESLCKLPI